MNDGFFSSSVIKSMDKSKPLPTQLHVEFPPEKPPKEKKVIESISKTPQMLLDIECYINYFLVKFKRVSDGEFFEFEQTEHQPLDIGRVAQFVKKHEILSFNGNSYDIPMLRLALTEVSCKQLKMASNELIGSHLSVWRFEKEYELPKFKIKHIDIIEVIKGFNSLKIYAARLGCEKLQDLPIELSAVLSDCNMDEIADYCGNDLDCTDLLFENQKPQIELRRVMSKKYNIDLLSKSDAQIAEAVIKEEIYNLTGKEIPEAPEAEDRFYYKAPHFIKFNTNILNDVLDIVTKNPFTIDGGGRPKMPPELSKLKVKIGHSIYKLGMGGLHSTEKSAFHVANQKFSLWDWDVTSYYPEIIRQCRLYPKHIGKPFLNVFGNIVDERVEAKHRCGEIKKEIEELKKLL